MTNKISAMRRRIVAAATPILACLAMVTPAVGAMAPNDVIQEAVDLLTEGLDARREEFAADEDALFAFIDGILLPRFDRRFAATAVLGKHWRTASDEQKDRFIAAFYATIVHKYAGRLLEFEMERVSILPFRGDATKKIADVKTHVRTADGSKIDVYYTLVNRKDKWNLFDVTIEGISYRKSFKTDLETEIRRSSLQKVIERLERDAGIVVDE